MTVEAAVTVVNTTDTNPAVDMLYDARIRLAYLQRYAPQMGCQPEGARYIAFIDELAIKALQYAKAHCADPKEGK